MCNMTAPILFFVDAQLLWIGTDFDCKTNKPIRIYFCSL